jgi:hypothetical protein
VLALIAVFALFPAVLGNKLREMGVETFDIAGMKVALLQAKAANQRAASQLMRDSVTVDTIVGRLRALGTASPPQLSARLDSAATRLELTQRTNTALDSSLRRSIAVQDSILSNVSPSQVAQEGWIFCGRANEQRTAWDPRSVRIVADSPTQLVSGNEVRLTSDAYLRDASKPLEHAQAPILGVLARGTSIGVISRDSSHAIGGGWFLWAKVRRGAS